MTILNVVIIIALLATAAALVGGVATMAHGGEFDRRHGVQLMFTRVGLQGVTLLLLVIALLLNLR